ncbi:unnamed protein product [Protopolystoma xenopodis]|uniref:Uncharacterized protein n=1 Tax=Protopolystoma xenopodis TaxID=117903 RepID=A0A448XPY0_9PLAT|nr:unnamed protein product [Protopolystoma xenopodis]
MNPIQSRSPFTADETLGDLPVIPAFCTHTHTHTPNLANQAIVLQANWHLNEAHSMLSPCSPFGLCIEIIRIIIAILFVTGRHRKPEDGQQMGAATTLQQSLEFGGKLTIARHINVPITYLS